MEQLEDRRLLAAVIITPASFTESASDPPFTPFLPGKSSAPISVPTLRDAVMEANFLKGPSTILLNAGTYQLSILNESLHESLCKTGDLNITSKQLTIEGAKTPDGQPATTIDQAAIDRIFQLNSAKLSVTFANLKLIRGEAVDDGSAAAPCATTGEGGAIWANGDTVTLSNVILKYNEARGFQPHGACGGGVYAVGGTLTLSSVTLENNSAQEGGPPGPSTDLVGAFGGGVYANGARLTLSNVTFKDNVATAADPTAPPTGLGACGGGVFATASAVTLTHVTFDSNVAMGGDGVSGGPGGDGRGGGLFAGATSVPSPLASSGKSAKASVTLTSCTFTYNAAQGGKGADAPPRAAGAAGGDGGSGEGGGMYLQSATVALTASDSFSHNVALGGAGGTGGLGAIETGPGPGGYGGGGMGGGMYLFGGTLRGGGGSEFEYNVAGGAAGGDGGSYQSHAGASGGSGGQGLGGGVYAEEAAVTLSSVSFSENAVNGGAGGGGGGVRVNQGGSGGCGGMGGGGMFALTSSPRAGIKLTSVEFSDNVARGADGGSGGAGAVSGGNGGWGGYGVGGGLYFYGSLIGLTSLSVTGNVARGGGGGAGYLESTTGGTGGSGGYGWGGGIAIFGLSSVKSATANLASSTISGNEAVGGSVSYGGGTSTSLVAAGGGEGGGVYLDSGCLVVSNSRVFDNTARGGDDNVSGNIGTDLAGDGLGGGFYVCNSASYPATLTLTKMTSIYHNTAAGGTGGAYPPVANGGGIFGPFTKDSTVDIHENLPNNY